MKKLQLDVQEFLQTQKLECGLEFRLLDLLSELGEVAKEILIASKYGKEIGTMSPKFGEEVGDLQFCLLALANQTGIDLEAATKYAMEKYRNRIHLKGHPGSN